MRVVIGLGFGLLCSVAVSVQAAPLVDADALYCLTVYAEARDFGASGDPALARIGQDAQRRWLPLSQRESDLLNDNPSRHAIASAIAKRRLAVLPTGAARGPALKGAYEACRGREEAAERGTTPTSTFLNDTEALYCLTVYGEVKNFATASDAAAARLGQDAQRRWLPLSQRDNDLLNDDPERHAAASREASQRFATLPAAPPAARNAALQRAYDDCRGREDAGAQVDPERAQLLADRRFCRDLLARATKVGPRMRSLFNPAENASLDEVRRVAKALALPLPGRALSPAEDREANRLLAGRREAFNLAMARFKDGDDPMLEELANCHEDYRRGLLGGPSVVDEAAPVSATH